MAPPSTVRSEARDYRALAGDWPESNDIRGDGQARSSLRPETITLGGHQNSSCDAQGSDIGKRCLLRAAINCGTIPDTVHKAISQDCQPLPGLVRYQGRLSKGRHPVSAFPELGSWRAL